MTNPESVHSESESHPWAIDVPDHPARKDSPEYVAARTKMNQIAAQATGLIYGQGPFEDHHGGALWLQDSQGWFMVRNQVGIEWSAQFCADPAKIDLLRQNAKRLYDLVAPQLKQRLDPDGLLDTPITDAGGVAKWTDSIFNAGVPLHPSFHTGVLPAQAAPAAGTQPAPAAGARQRTRSPPGCTITPRPSPTFSCSSTTTSSCGSPISKATPPRSRPWTSAAAATPAFTCSTPPPARSWPSKNMRQNALAPR